MSGWRFFPLRDSGSAGVLVGPDRKPAPAVFLTADEARERARRERMGFA